ncbi:protein DpdE [Lolliginicoccus suaedae]|uniref:protein DpdE n=1 Tax=Lolliginicoccus suaedae TaxID=2605429 RepID=UPI00165980F8|nr:protein DpdE [Lolliginicoccus suaedae]
MFVTTESNPFGPGSAIRQGATNNEIIVAYFDTPERHDSNPIELAVARDRQLKAADLPPETRVFWREENGDFPAWRSGRIDYIADDRYAAVKSVNGQLVMRKIADLHIRWKANLDDPLGFAAAGVFESPYNSEIRSPFLRSVLLQRKEARGMAGLLSTPVELYPHQLDAARKVLSDHTQRYLLADEVGLGKTIETILILRQLLLDLPQLHVQFILPDHIVEQWRSEVEQKLRRRDFPDAVFSFGTFSTSADWRVADIVVVDEAHNLAKDATSDDECRRGRHRALSEIVHSSPRLLLLSATPVLHHESTFLAMLNLLDPQAYRLEGIEELRRRVSSRQALGRGLLRLTSRTPSFLLGGIARDLGKVIAGDLDLESLLNEIVLEIDEAKRGHLIHRFRRLVTDRYQVHRRMIRSRRTPALREEFPLSARTGASSLDLTDELLLWSGVTNYIEECRNSLLVAVEQGELESASAAQLIGEIVAQCLDATELARIAEASGGVLEAPTDHHLCAGEVIAAVADALTYEVSATDRIVVFTSSSRGAASMRRALEDYAVAPNDIRLVDGATSPTEIQQSVEDLRASRCHWLIADGTAHEGLNLQFATVLVHVGLPFEVNELEQRIGRVDRWKRTPSPWRSIVVEPPHGVGHRWGVVVADGFDVHNQSVAGLQRAVEEISVWVWKRLLDPYDDISSISERVREELEREKRAVEEQDAIDSASIDSEELGFSARLRDFDRALDSEIGDIVDSLMATCPGAISSGVPGNLRFVREKVAESANTYRLGNRDRKEQMPLVPWHRILRDFQVPLQQSWTGVRAVASSEGIGLLRTGSLLMDALEDYLRHDDRGRSWGMWRWSSAYSGPNTMWLRFDLHVEARRVDLSGHQLGHLDANAVQRRVDTALPPLVQTTWRDIFGDAPDEGVLALLGLPYTKPDSARSGRGDFNLSHRRIHAAVEILPEGVWAEELRKAEQSVQQSFLASAEVVEMKLRARRELESSHDVRIQALEARARATPGDAAAVRDEIQLEDALRPLLEDAVCHPEIIVDSFGMIVLSEENPFDRGRDEA